MRLDRARFCKLAIQQAEFIGVPAPILLLWWSQRCAVTFFDGNYKYHKRWLFPPELKALDEEVDQLFGLTTPPQARRQSEDEIILAFFHFPKPVRKKPKVAGGVKANILIPRTSYSDPSRESMKMWKYRPRLQKLIEEQHEITNLPKKQIIMWWLQIGCAVISKRKSDRDPKYIELNEHQRRWLAQQWRLELIARMRERMKDDRDGETKETAAGGK